MHSGLPSSATVSFLVLCACAGSAYLQDPESPPMPSWLSVSGFLSGVVVRLLSGQPVDWKSCPTFATSGMCREFYVCLCGVHTVFELVWCMCVRQSVPSYGALHLVVGMNFSVPETTDIWSADKTALVPFITELTVRYTTRVRALTGTQGCVRERETSA
jgi:hypothetical protein